MDAADERAQRTIEAPLLVLWGAKNIIGRLWNVLDVWRGATSSLVEGRALDCGHFLAEEQPDEVLRDLLRFFETEE
jgi:haloacetate dehalogenase